MSTGSVKVLPDKLLSLRDRLSRLTFTNTWKLLGPQGRLLISSNANKWQISIPDDVQFDGDTLRVKFPIMIDEPPVTVIIERNPEALQSLRIAAAGGELLGAAFKLLGEMVNASAVAAPPDALVASLRSGLEAFVEGGDKPRLTITLPDRATLDQLSLSLARLLSAVAQPAAS